MGKIVAFTLLSRLLIFGVALLRFLTLTNQLPYTDLFYQLDANWYLSIATGSYQWYGPGVQSNIVFFPFYPLLAKLVFFVADARLALIAISNLAFFLSVYLLYQLAKLEFDQQTAERTVLLFVFFPLSFVLSLPYAESLFITLTLGSLMAIKRGKLVLATLTGSFATLTRIQGIVLLPTMAIYYLRYNTKRWWALLSLLVVAAGTLSYFLYLYFRFGDFFIFFHTLESSWDRHMVLPLTVIWRLVTFLWYIPKNHYLFGLGLFDVGMFSLFIFLLVKGLSILPPYLSVYGISIFLLTFSTYISSIWFYPLASANRYLTVAFPVFMILAKMLRQSWLFLTYLIVSNAFLLILSWNFFSGKWVF